MAQLHRWALAFGRGPFRVGKSPVGVCSWDGECHAGLVAGSGCGVGRFDGDVGVVGERFDIGGAMRLASTYGGNTQTDGPYPRILDTGVITQQVAA